jgi:putative peptidoglycan lipid II flippase
MGLLRSTAVVGSFTMLSRVLGFVRDIMFARYFGAGAATDAFFIAFKIPNFMRRLFAEGAFSQAFVPVLSEYKAQRTPEETRALVSAVAGTLGAILLLLSALGMLAAPLLVGLFAPGFIDDPAKFALTVELLPITFPYIFFISLTALAGGILNTWGRFAVPAVTPVWLNISLIVATVVSGQFEIPVMALAWGVFAAGLIQLIFQLPFIARIGLLAWPVWGWSREGVQRIVKLMIPAIFGSSVVQINLLLDTVIASVLATGSVSWLYYSDRLAQFPLGVFGIALSTVILPSLSARHAESNPDAFSRTLDWALRWVLLIGLPAMVGLVVLAGPILTTLFLSAEFRPEDVLMARLSLMAYALGLLGFILVKVLAPGFYARQDTRTPVRIGIYAMVGNMAMNVLFVVPMVMAGFEGPHAGLALATSLSAFLNAGLLFRRLRREGVYRAEPGWWAFTFKIAAATAVMGAMLWWFAGGLQAWFAAGPFERAARLGVLIAGAGIVYFALLPLLRVPLGLLRGHTR